MCRPPPVLGSKTLTLSQWLLRSWIVRHWVITTS